MINGFDVGSRGFKWIDDMIIFILHNFRMWVETNDIKFDLYFFEVSKNVS